MDAGIAQLVEQLIRNQQVAGSSPAAGSIDFSRPRDFRPFLFDRVLAPFNYI